MIRKALWGLMAMLATLVAGYAFTSIAAPSLRSPFVADLFSEKALRTMAHLGAGGIALVVGAFQFTRLRFNAPRAHRVLGRVYLVAVVISGIAAGLLAPWSDGGASAHAGFGLLALLWVLTALIAWDRARSGDYRAHRGWMIRSYALCLAAVTLRLYLPASSMLGVPFEASYPAIAWLCWVPNLIVAEWLVVPSSLLSVEPSPALSMTRRW